MHDRIRYLITIIFAALSQIFCKTLIKVCIIFFVKKVNNENFSPTGQVIVERKEERPMFVYSYVLIFTLPRNYFLKYIL